MKAHFKSNPIVEQLPPKSVIDLVPYYRVAVKLTYIDRDGKQYDVPCGFETDGASVIRWLIWVIAVAIFALGIWTSEWLWIISMTLLLVCTRTGPWFPAAILHDFLGSSWRNNAIFYRAMRANKVAMPIAVIYWLGPTLFGKPYALFYRWKHRKSNT